MNNDDEKKGTNRDSNNKAVLNNEKGLRIIGPPVDPKASLLVPSSTTVASLDDDEDKKNETKTILHNPLVVLQAVETFLEHHAAMILEDARTYKHKKSQGIRDNQGGRVEIYLQGKAFRQRYSKMIAKEFLGWNTKKKKAAKHTGSDDDGDGDYSGDDDDDDDAYTHNIAQVLMDYFQQQAAKDPRVHNFEWFDYSLLVSYGKVDAQLVHIDLRPEMAQLIVAISEGAIATDWYTYKTDITNVKDWYKVMKQVCLDDHQDWSCTCASVGQETTATVHNHHQAIQALLAKHGTKYWKRAWKDVRNKCTTCDNHTEIEILVQKYGNLLHPCLTPGSSTSAASLFAQRGSVAILPGGVPHNGPEIPHGDNNMRVVAFAYGRPKHRRAKAATTADSYDNDCDDIDEWTYDSNVQEYTHGLLHKIIDDVWDDLENDRNRTIVRDWVVLMTEQSIRHCSRGKNQKSRKQGLPESVLQTQTWLRETLEELQE